MEWQNDTELFDLMTRELYSAVFADVLDDLGFTHQMLRPQIRPLYAGALVAGRAMTVLMTDVYERPPNMFDTALRALDCLKPNDLYVVGRTSERFACWGELMSTAARARGARGCVIDGFTRDAKGIEAMNFPVFCAGTWAQDTRGRGEVMDFNLPIDCGGIRIEPGQILLGDVDGVVAIPREAEVEAITKALEKARGEKVVKQALEQGMSATEAFRKYGIL
jgi:regulator of RNase E activity RraA